MKKIISIITVLTMVLGLSSVAMADKENEIIVDEPTVIEAEDIGIKEMAIGDDFEDNEVIEEDFAEEDSDDEVTTEDEDLDVPVEPEEEIPETEEPETESPGAPEGKAEGYVAGTYFEPNNDDCEIEEVCYSCENDGHAFIHCVSYDEDNNCYVYEEWCEICGHGEGRVISEEEFNELGVDCDVEF